jgi:hypothetical protein
MKVPPNILADLDSAISAAEREQYLPGRDELLRLLREARLQAERALRTPLGTTSAILGKEELALALALSATSGAAPPPLPSDRLIGLEPYEDLDPGWLGSFFRYLLSERVPFPTHAAGVPTGQPGSGIVHIADDVTLAMIGDWGTGNPSSLTLGQRVASLRPRPNYTIHLGDVYYSGTPDEQRSRFVDIWPPGADGAFALNSNHDMYSGGAGYFSVALRSPKFSLQQGLSYFALENAHWIVFGLDSAYGSDSWLYQKGELNVAQIAFLGIHAERARASGKRVMILTHHQPIEMDGSLVTPLCDQVTQAVGVKELHWYWGHIHAAAVLKPRIVNGVTILGRCAGHGGVPYEPVDLTRAIAWTETKLAGDPEERRRALNGFAVVRLDGAAIHESFLGEDGSVRYPEAAASAAAA